MTPATELERLFAPDYAAALRRIPKPDPIAAYKPLRRTTHEYERQEMLDGRERYATGDHTP